MERTPENSHHTAPWPRRSPDSVPSCAFFLVVCFMHKCAGYLFVVSRNDQSCLHRSRILVSFYQMTKEKESLAGEGQCGR